MARHCPFLTDLPDKISPYSNFKLLPFVEEEEFGLCNRKNVQVVLHDNARKSFSINLQRLHAIIAYVLLKEFDSNRYNMHDSF